MNFEKTLASASLPEDSKKQNKSSKLSTSEVIKILTLFKTSNYRNLKHFYLFYESSIKVVERF